MIMRLLAAAAATLAIATPAIPVAAWAADPAKVSKDLYTLFSDGCVANMATPDGVKAWAASRKFEAVTSKAALEALAGGEEGMVWEARMPSGPFALALRASGACAVYGDKLDAAAVESDFTGFADALKRTGRTVDVVKDDRQPGDHGERHDLIYIAKGEPSTLTVAMIANQKPGGLFQATLQISPPQIAPAPVVDRMPPPLPEAKAKAKPSKKKKVSGRGSSR